MIASLPMYLRSELVDAHNTYWSLIHTHLKAMGITGPDTLSQPEDLYAHWQSPELFLSQTCGLPYRRTLHGSVQMIGTPDFRIEGCPPGYYRSALVVRREDADKSLTDFDQSTLAFNSTDSQSGYASIQNHCKPHSFWFQNTLESGGHRQSTIEIAKGHADIAAVDAMTWRLVQRYDDHASELAVMDWTAPTPGLPYITANHQDANAIFDAVSNAIEELPDDIRKLLDIYSLVQIDADDYLAVDNQS